MKVPHELQTISLLLQGPPEKGRIHVGKAQNPINLAASKGNPET